MKEYNDIELNGLISEGKEATFKLSNLKFKNQTHEIKKLLIFRRNRLGLIRKRAIELNLTEIDLGNIRDYVQMKTL